MCGVAGIFSPDGDAPLALAGAMGATLEHRGPDAEGYLLARGGAVRAYHAALPPMDGADGHGELALAHRRLSIIDLVAGAQPLADESGQTWVAFNGEIYNYRQLRGDLQRRGHHFATASDTEVLVHLYEEHGPAMLARLNGIFAFALWDARRRRLLLARDRVGVKPLYYAQRGGRVSFASEVRALLAAGVPAVLDGAALAQHFVFQNTLDDRTWFGGVRMLRPGHFLLLEVGARPLEQEYWRFTPQPDDGRGLAAWVREFREQFEQTVRRQLVSDVPVGTYLSGGLDTGAIAAITAREIEPLHSFTCGFSVDGVRPDERLFDESAWAARMSQEFGTLHHELRLDPSSADAVLPEVVWHLEEPRAGISYQVALTARLVSQKVRVVLSGVGGDELFAGYPWRHRLALEEASEEQFEARYFAAWQRLLPASGVADLFAGDLRDEVARTDARECFRAAFGRATGPDRLARALAFEVSTFLHALLVVEDKLSMASSIETRAPFTDNAMLELAERVPSRLKFAGGPTKLVVREALQSLVPPGTLDRPKVGFTPPEASWLRSGRSRWLAEAALSERLAGRGLMRPDRVAALVEEHRSGRANHRQLLWSIACFEWWCRLFLDGERPPAPAR